MGAGEIVQWAGAHTLHVEDLVLLPVQSPKHHQEIFEYES